MREPPGGVQRRRSSCSTCGRWRRPRRKIDPDVNVLVIVHPKELVAGDRSSRSTSSRCAAGTSLVFVDPLAEADHCRRRSAEPDGGDDGGQVLASRSRCSNAWGVRLQPEQGGRRSRPRAAGGHAPGRAAGAAPRHPRPRPGQLQPEGCGHRRTVQHQRGHRRRAGAGEGRARRTSSRCCSRARTRNCCPRSASRCCSIPPRCCDGFKPTRSALHARRARHGQRATPPFRGGPPAGVTLPAGQLDAEGLGASR